MAWLAGSTTSLAAEVEVNETDRPPNRAVLEFEGEDGENNEVTLSYAGNDGEFIEIEIRDDGAALDPGNGCKGGDEAGEPVLCKLHRPYLAAIPLCKGPGPCSVDPVQFALENSWDTGMTIHLADGEDSLDAGDFEREYSDQIPLSVFGGSGDDTILTSDGRDEIYPGTGSDDVNAGAGNDRVSAEPTADGSDRFDLGPDGDGVDVVSYARRWEPVVLIADRSGAAGENDKLISANFVVGGSGNDSLFGGDSTFALDGRDGDDTLVGGVQGERIYGGPGDDSLYGNGGNDALDGEQGDDLAVAGPGNDRVFELLHIAESLGTVPFASTDGADVADGGEGDDRFELGPGPDLVEGGPGDDTVYGELGGDRLAGGGGDDIVAGEAGVDRLWGGTGSDDLRADVMQLNGFSPFPAKVDGWRDEVRCGADADRAFVNPWDDVRQCERTSVLPLVRFLKTFRNRRAGTAQLSISVGSPGRLVMFGRGVRKVRRRLTTRVEDPEVQTMLPVRLKGRASKALRRRGRATANLAIRYQPDGGVARTERRRLRLVRRR